jgi:hypothetical protein
MICFLLTAAPGRAAQNLPPARFAIIKRLVSKAFFYEYDL